MQDTYRRIAPFRVRGKHVLGAVAGRVHHLQTSTAHLSGEMPVTRVTPLCNRPPNTDWGARTIWLIARYYEGVSSLTEGLFHLGETRCYRDLICGSRPVLVVFGIVGVGRLVGDFRLVCWLVSGRCAVKILPLV